MFYVVSRNDLGWGTADTLEKARSIAKSHGIARGKAESKKVVEFVAVFEAKEHFTGINDWSGAIQWDKAHNPVKLYKIENGKETDETEYWLKVNNQ